ncbi:unnamed protein product, partial [Microthlaspi erraticum]
MNYELFCPVPATAATSGLFPLLASSLGFDSAAARTIGETVVLLSFSGGSGT